MQGINLTATLQGRRLENPAFPGYFLSGHGHDERHRRLIEAFFQWQATWLLLLPDLRYNQRPVAKQK
jgi:hypothetical protein